MWITRVYCAFIEITRSKTPGPARVDIKQELSDFSSSGSASAASSLWRYSYPIMMLTPLYLISGPHFWTHFMSLGVNRQNGKNRTADEGSPEPEVKSRVALHWLTEASGSPFGCGTSGGRTADAGWPYLKMRDSIGWNDMLDSGLWEDIGFL